MRATEGDPRRYPGPFGNLPLNSQLQVWKGPAHVLNTRELSRQVAIAIERRSRREIALACDDVPVLDDLGKVAANDRIIALGVADVRHRLCSRASLYDSNCLGYRVGEDWRHLLPRSFDDDERIVGDDAEDR